MSTPTVAILVARRPDGGRRDELWKFCRDRWRTEFPNWPIHEADVDGPFNRGAALNEAHRAAEADVYLVVDADVAIDPQQVRDAVDLAAATGRAVFPFTRYIALNRSMTDRVLDGYDGNWAPGKKFQMDGNHWSSVIAVPADLWAETRGFDERCWGWGHDDGIFAHTLRVLGGGLERLPGSVWHLEHPVSPHTSRSDAGNRAAGALARRYYRELDPEGVRAMIAERQVDDAVTLAVLTDGRRDCVEKSIPAALRNLQGLPITHIIVSDDSGDPEYAAWLRRWVPGAEILTSPRRTGFAENVRRTWEAALGTGTPWVFWLEDDFEVLEPVDIRRMADVLTHEPHLTQMVLKRQPWFPNEVAAGDLIAVHDDAVQKESWRGEWVEHAKGHWTNPHLVSRRFLAEHEWPRGAASEATFARQVMRGDRRSAFWGLVSDAPLVHHMGERKGRGY